MEEDANNVLSYMALNGLIANASKTYELTRLTKNIARRDVNLTLDKPQR